MSQRKLADFLGIDPPAVSLLLRGKRKITAAETVQIATALGVSVEEILEHLGVEAPLGASVPIVGTFNDKGEITPRKKGPRAPGNPVVPADAVAIRNEDPISAHYGWTAYYQPRGNGISQDAVGRTSVCTLKNGKQVMGYLRAGMKSGRYTVVPLANPPIENVEVASAAPVLWVKVG